MACPLDDSLSALISGELAEPEADAVRTHLDSCESCRTTVAALALGHPRSSEDPSDPVQRPRSPGPTPGSRIDRYVIERLIGAGAMGVVYAAKDAALDRVIALKLLHGDHQLSGTLDPSGGDVGNEARTLARLDDPNVVKVWDVGVWEGRMFIAMELVQGQTLRAWMQKPQPYREVLSRLLGAGAGLAAAHDKGIIHRDFKPDNVLIAASGRALVTDFGLATESNRESTKIAGTPAYMAPEQFSGRAADEKSDQFSFAVTCVEALTGRRPYSGATLAELKLTVGQGQLDLSALSALPRSVKLALSRALAFDPAARWPDMRALLSALTPRANRTKSWVAAALGVALLGSGGLWWRSTVCSGGAARVQAVWNASKRATLSQAFVGTGLPWAADAAAALNGELDRWSEGWSAAFTEACTATRVRGEQSEELLDLRMSCLDRQLSETRALIELFERADRTVIGAASRSLSRLTPLSACADLEALRDPVKPPSAADRPRISAARQALGEVIALRAAGRFKEAALRAEALTAEALLIGYRPFEAEVLTLKGQLDADLDAFDAASASLHKAVAAAEASGYSRAAGAAWAFLIEVESDKRAKKEEAERAQGHAEAVIEHLGRPRDLSAVLAHNTGKMLLLAGKHQEAKQQLTRALELYRALDPSSPMVAASLNAIGDVVRAEGDAAGSLKYHQDALALVVARLGEHHPDVALAQKNIGNVYWKQSELDTALSWYERALDLQKQALGEDSLEYVSTLNNVASVHIRQQKLAEAEGELRRVIAVMEDKLGPFHRDLYGRLNNLAVVLRYLNRLADAEAILRRALDIATKAVGEEHDMVATTLVNLGDTLLAEKKFEDSVAAYERSAVITEKIYGSKHPNLAECYGGAAFPLMQLHQYARARALAEKALAIFADGNGVPMVVAQVRFVHAQATWELEPARRATSVAEAREARKILAGAGAQAEDMAEVDAWIAGHRAR